MKQFKIELKSEFGATLLTSFVTARDRGDAERQARNRWANDLRKHPNYYIIVTEK